ncbi:MAG: hypothetical protein GEV09_28285 [Pseudonocardiaceae bacterium]|nr:hypothetical protein [Pseudonocardiaceae bacterium]
MTVWIPSETVKPGDVIVSLGDHQLVREIVPYTYTGQGALPDWLAGARIAHTDDGWAYTLVPGVGVEIAR